MTEWPSSTSSADDLLYEGRAITLTYTSSSTSVRSAVFSAASHSADYARQTNLGSSVTLRLAVLPASCELSQLDMAFLVDSSGSIDALEFSQTKEFLRSVVSYQDIGPNRTRIAIATFASDRSINPNRTAWPTVPDCPAGTWWLQPGLLPAPNDQPLCACAGNSACTPSINQSACDNVGAIDRGLTVYAWINQPLGRGSCGPGGTGAFDDGIPGGGVRDDLLFMNGDSLTTVLDVINNSMPLTGGFTWTSAGIERMRDRVFNVATGMRSASAAVPRLLVVLTDGQATCKYPPNLCFDPAQSARQLREDGVTILAVGVGSESQIGNAELESIAGTQANVFRVANFAQLPDLSAQIDGRSCGACIALPVDRNSTISTGIDEYTCAQACGASQSVTVRILSGLADIYTSPSKYGGARNNTASVTGLASGNTVTLPYSNVEFVIVRGRASNTRLIIQVGDPEILNVALSVAVSGASDLGTLVVDLNASVTALGNTPHRFVASSGSALSYFSVSPDGTVTVASELTAIASSTVTLQIRASPRQTSQCSAHSVVSNVRSAVDIIVSISVTSLSPTSQSPTAPTDAPTSAAPTAPTAPTEQPSITPTAAPSAAPNRVIVGESGDAESNAGETAGTVIGVLFLLAFLALLALFLVRRQRAVPSKSDVDVNTSMVNPLHAGPASHGHAAVNGTYMHAGPASHGHAAVNETYSAVKPARPPPPMEPPRRPPPPPSIRNNGAEMNDTYQPAVAATDDVGQDVETNYAIPISPESTSTSPSTYVDPAAADSAYAIPGTLSNNENSNYATALAAPVVDEDRHAAVANGTYMPAVPPRHSNENVAENDYELPLDSTNVAIANISDASNVTSSGTTFDSGSAAIVNADSGAIANTAYVVADAVADDSVTDTGSPQQSSMLERLEQARAGPVAPPVPQARPRVTVRNRPTPPTRPRPNNSEPLDI